MRDKRRYPLLNYCRCYSEFSMVQNLLQNSLLAGFLCVLLIAGAPGCRESTPIDTHSDPVALSPQPFKTGYEITLPEEWIGPGFAQFLEGTFFTMNRENPLGRIWYAYCGPTYCEDFGDTLPIPVPEKIQVKNLDWTTTDLQNRMDLSLQGEIDALLYYSDTDPVLGRLYMMEQGVFRQGLMLEYRPQLHGEILGILESIARD